MTVPIVITRFCTICSFQPIFLVTQVGKGFRRPSTSNVLSPDDLRGEIDYYQMWHEAYANAVEAFDFGGLTYKFSNSGDVTVTADLDDTGLYVNTKAENVYKIFDNRYGDDSFIGNSGTQVFRSEGGFDTATGGKDFDVFRVDGKMLAEWQNQAVYDTIGHRLHVTDYEYGELLSIEDFGLTSASEIYSTIENGYTKIWAQTEWGEYNLIKLSGEFTDGIVYSRGTEWSNAGVDYGVKFYDVSKTISGTSSDDDLALFGDVWRVDLDTQFINLSGTALSGVTFEGGDGTDDFAGGAGDDHFSGGDGADRVFYLDSEGISVGVSPDGSQTVIFDGMGHGGIDTIESIRDLYASTGSDYIDLSTNPDEIERVVPSVGTDTIIGNLVVNYWNLFNSPDDPRYGTEWYDGVQNGVINAWVEVDLANQLATKNIEGGQFEGTYQDILDGTRGLIGSEGNDILKVTVNTDFGNVDAWSPGEHIEGWALGLLGKDFIEDWLRV